MSQLLVSVIMPTFNHAEFIRESVESILNQSYEDLELIIIDNYSQDNTQGIIESFTDKRIRYFKFSNKGIIAASRNYGIQQARGEYMAFIDSDDTWAKDKLKKQIDILENDKDCQMVFSQSQASYADGNFRGKIFGPKDLQTDGYIYDKLIQYNFIVSSSVVVRKTVFDHIGCFDEAESLRCAEDYDLWLRIARKHRIRFLPQVLGLSRVHSYNTNAASQRLQKAINVINKQLSCGWATVKQANRAKANFYFREGWAFLNNDVRLARFYFWKAYQLNSDNLKIIFLSLAGLGISFFPLMYHCVQSLGLDRKIARSILNSQNL